MDTFVLQNIAIGALSLITLFKVLGDAWSKRKDKQQEAEILSQQSLQAAMISEHTTSLANAQAQATQAQAQAAKVSEVNVDLQLKVQRLEDKDKNNEKRIADLEANKTTQADTIMALTAQVSELLSEVGQLKRDLAQANATIEMLSEANTALKKGKE